MAGAAEIARLLTQGTAPLAGDQDNALHTGTIVSWDRFTGVNSVNINGVILPNLDSLQSGIGISYTPGDVVVIQRKQTKYYILGKVASPLGSAGSAPAFQASNAAYTNLGATGGVWTAFSSPAAPSVTTYIGSSRRALVMWQANITAANSSLELGFRVSGATTWPPGFSAGTSIISRADGVGAPILTMNTCSGQYLIEGGFLNKGQNTFTLMYRVLLYPSGTGADVGNLNLTVIPL